MKKEYCRAEMEIITFYAADVITESNVGEGDGSLDD